MQSILSRQLCFINNFQQNKNKRDANAKKQASSKMAQSDSIIQTTEVT